MKVNQVTEKMLALTVSGLVAFTTGCSSGVSGSSGSTSTGSGGSAQSTGGSGSTSPDAVAQWQSLGSQMNGFGSSSSTYSGDPLIMIDTINKNLDLLIPIPVFSGLTPIGNVPVGSTGGITFGPATMPDGSEAWEVIVPLSVLLKGASFPSSFNALPDGQPLPYFPSAEVSGLAVSIPSRPGYTVNIYLGVKAVAVFVGIPGFKTPLGFGYDIVNADKSRNVGYIALTPSSGTYPAGIYVAAQVPTDLAQVMANLLNQ